MIDLRCGDCYEMVKEIPSNSVDLVYIDIPYLVKNMVSGGGSIKKLTGFTKDSEEIMETRRKTFEELANIMNGIDFSILDELERVLKNINMYIWCSKEQFLYILEWIYKKKCNFDLLVWCKTNPTPFCNNTWLPDVEYCFCIREKGKAKLNNGYQLKSKYHVAPTNVKDKKLFKHLTIKPLDLIKRHILHSTNEGDVVLDCFMGSGTTGVACKELNRNFIGIEINEEYFNIACERINKGDSNEEK